MTDLERKQQEQIELLLQTVNRLNNTIDELNATIKDLREQLGKNSKNSSKPPSSDGYKKPAPKSLRKSSGKKQGGQKRHDGVHLSVLAKPDKIITHMPSACVGCPRFSECQSKATVVEKRHVSDANVVIDVIQHQTLCVDECSICACSMTGKFPDNVSATVQYGSNLQALAIALNTVGAVSIKRTHEILSAVFNIPLSTGTISNMVSRFAKSVESTYEKLKGEISSSSIAHFDETGTRVDKKLHWVHVASNERSTFLSISQKHGQKGMDEAMVLPNFHGIAVHDCWASYWKYPKIQHSVCCAHLQRELVGIQENNPEQTWATDFISLLLEMKKVKEKAIQKGANSLSYYHLNKFSKRYDELLKQGFSDNPLPSTSEKKRGRKKQGKVRALLTRLENFKESVCLFIKNFAVPYDNNLAERDLRMIKVKTKVSGCFRTNEGAENYLKIMSYVGTANKRDINAYEAILSAINGNPSIIFN